MRSRLAMRADAVVRTAIVRGLSGVLPYVIVNEYPKSGGSWLSQMLAAYLGMPFPRNRMPALKPSIMQGHYLRPWGMGRVVAVWRDGRDVMTSWYYHCLFKNERENGHLVELVRRDLRFADFEDIQRNLPNFIEYVFARQRHPRFSWAQFVQVWANRPGVTHVRYEDLLADTPAELWRVGRELGRHDLSLARAAAVSDEYSFERQTGRRSGVQQTNSFLRKGIAGDWRNHFSLEARRVFAELAGRELIRLGYEVDDRWVSAESVAVR